MTDRPGNQKMRFRRQNVPLGDDHIPVLVASEDSEPKAVFMSYESFLELAATLYTAIEALRAAGVDPSVLSELEEDEEDVEEDPDDAWSEFEAWDAEYCDRYDGRPNLRLVVGG